MSDTIRQRAEALLNRLMDWSGSDPQLYAAQLDAIDAFGRAYAAEALAKVADDVAAMPRFAVDADRRGRMLQWPHGEFLYREHVIEAITLPVTVATSTPEESR
jgi:hypothetical protein